MTPFVSFLLKANIALILMYGFYFLCFRRDTFYGLIRWYLLAAIISAVIFPLINISGWLTSRFATPDISQNISGITDQFVYIYPQIVVEPAIVTRTIPFALIFWWGWLTVAVFMLSKRLFQFVYIIRLWRRCPRMHYGDRVIIAVEKNIQPFSFFGCIFLNPLLYAKNELDEIVTHEQVHCQKRHTVDILLVETLVCLFWFNPFAWLLRRDIKQNIEYYTDQMTLRLSNFDRKHYQYSLLRVSDRAFQIVNHFHFNNNLLKKRIIMMNKKESPRIVTAKYLLVIPALAVAFLIVQIPSLQAVQTRNAAIIGDSPVITTVAVLPAVENVESNVPIEAFVEKVAKPESIASNRNVQLIDSGKQESLSNAVQSSMDIKLSDKPLIFVDGKEITKEEMNQLDPKTIGSISVLKDASATNKYGDKGANGVVLIQTKGESPQVETVQISGKVTIVKDGQPLRGVAVLVKGSTTGTVTDMDGKYLINAPVDASLQFSYIDMPTMEIVVGNDRQINVTLDNGAESSDNTAISISNLKGKIINVAHPLYIVDGKEVGSMENISPHNIESMAVLKDEAATEKYGEKGKNGVVIITTKK
jgi:TonB-dependent SusC/RagA subfamily outer membrane receptor